MNYLVEKLTYDQLFRMSDPKRAKRSRTVHGPPLEIDSYQDSIYYAFNFKSNPSTTGLRHRGYIKFFRPRTGNTNKPLHKLECLVDCTCPDYKYRWAWANKQRGSGRVGVGSLNQAWNQAPRRTNPGSVPGLCKHILAAREFIYGLLSSFQDGEPDTAEKLNKLTRYAQKRWANFPGEMAKARARELRIAADKAARNAGRAPATAPAAGAPVRDVNLTGPATKLKDAKPAPLPPSVKLPAKAQMPAKPQPPKQVPLAVDPEKRGVGFQSPKAAKDSYTKQSAPKKQAQKPDASYAQFDKRFMRKENLETSAVVNAGQTDIRNMKALKEAIALVEELEKDALTAPEAPAGDFGSTAALEPSEPPVSDSAIGADTEGETALGLLQDIKGSLDRLADALAPLPEGPEDAEGAEDGAADVGAADVPVEADEIIPEPAEADIEGVEGGEEGSEEEDEEDMPNRRPEPIA